MKFSCSRMLVAALACSLFAAEAGADFSDDLISYWPFDGNLNDVEGPNNGTLESTSGTSSTTYDTGKFGQGIDLDKMDDQRVVIAPDESLDIETSQGGDGNLSISAWFRVDGFDQGWQALIAKGEGSSWRIARRGSSDPGIMSYAGGSGDIPTADDIGPPVNDGELHHVVAVSEQGVATRLFVDGQLVAQGGAPNLVLNGDPGNRTVMIGGNPDQMGDADGAYRAWNGLIDDVAIWNRALAPGEVNFLYNEGAGTSVADALGSDYQPLVGDVNVDNVVDLVDYGIIRDNLGDPGLYTAGDLDYDGQVTLLDFGIWKDNAPAAIANGVTIPEPSTVALALLGGLLAASRLRRRS